MPIFLGDKQIGAAALGNLPVSNITNTVLVDPSAAAFISVTGITGSAATAIVNLVTSLKNENLWDTFDAIYPMVGGNENAHKYNLKDPQDTNAAYRLNFVGGWTHNSSGSLPNGTNAYADTYYNLLSNLTTSNGNLSYFSFTNTASSDRVEIGAIDLSGPGGTPTDSFIRALFADRAYFPWGGGDPNTPQFSSNGFYLLNVTTSTTIDGWRNGTKIVNGGTTLNRGLPNLNVYIGALNDNGTPNAYSNRGCSFATIGDTIASGKETTFSTIVNDFQSDLGRYTY
jgi:hypothetical protein